MELELERVLVVLAVAMLVVALTLPALLWVLVALGVLPPGFCAI